MNKIYQSPPNIELAGSAAKSMVDNMASQHVEDLIEKHGLENIQLDDWIPLQPMCDFFNDVVEKGGSGQAFVAMGMKIAEQSEFPPEMRESLTLPMMLEGWDSHYQANHRGGTLPRVETVQKSDTSYELHLPEAHVYPYDLAYGMVYSFCKMLLPPDTNFSVTYDPDHTPYENWSDGVIIRVVW